MDNDFSYIKKGDIYLDSACQAMRPQPVIDALNNYYRKHNSCGERVKYPWGQETDRLVEATRAKVLRYLKLSPRKYFVSFTLNTTYGLNLLLSQFDCKGAGIKRVVTSDIEHNSPFLSTMAIAKRAKIPRVVLTRDIDGSLPIEKIPEHALVVVNAASNIDGRLLVNIKDVIKTVHKKSGFVIIDAAQAMAHSSEILHKTEADAICFSAHKMYAPSLGGMVVRRDLVKYIDTSFIGGGMVDDVDKETYLLSSDNKEHLYTKFESGLQAWGEIVALGAAIDWLNDLPKSAHLKLAGQSKRLHDYLAEHPKIHLVGAADNIATTMSFYVDGTDSHLLGAALADEGIMARTGYFCVHYYLDHVCHYPPLIRFSLGYHTRESDIDTVIKILDKLK